MVIIIVNVFDLWSLRDILLWIIERMFRLIDLYWLWLHLISFGICFLGIFRFVGYFFFLLFLEGFVKVIGWRLGGHILWF